MQGRKVRFFTAKTLVTQGVALRGDQQGLRAT
jgi:hypothetical protein